MVTLIERFESLLGPGGVVHNPQREATGNWSGHSFDSRLLLRPQSTEDVAAIMALCHQAGQPVVIQGGLSGVTGGTATGPEEISLSLERMNHIEALETHGRTLRVQAGVILQQVQEAAAAENLLFALDLGARGSATVGGLVATNAGGNQVIRYGMMREQVLGLEVVLADGRVLSSMNSLLKNNAGFDLKHLFIGTEGQLGVITRAVLRLRPGASFRHTALVAVAGFDHLPPLLNQVEGAFGGRLTAFEVLWRDFYVQSTRHLPGKPPLPRDYPFYVLLETSSSTPATATDFEPVLEAALDAGFIVDAVLAKSARERDRLWAVRDNLEALTPLRPVGNFDVSLPVSAMESYINNLRDTLEKELGLTQMVVFGHLGDGNLHPVIALGSDDPELRRQVEERVYGPLAAIGGSVSGEHGIGLEKKAYLNYSRTAMEIQVMQQLKQVLDPKGILNPGKVF